MSTNDGRHLAEGLERGQGVKITTIEEAAVFRMSCNALDAAAVLHPQLYEYSTRAVWSWFQHGGLRLMLISLAQLVSYYVAVSYTHLTLPTICSV